MLLLSVSGCTGINPLKVLGGGPNVAANVQAGQENNQTLGVSSSSDMNIVKPQARDITQSQDTTSVKSEKVERVTVNNNSLLLILIAIVGWLAPSPSEIGRGIRSLFSRNK